MIAGLLSWLLIISPLDPTWVTHLLTRARFASTPYDNPDNSLLRYSTVSHEGEGDFAASHWTNPRRYDPVELFRV
jgi:hypothetical protein